ncbi:hypothetical protein GCM10011510_19650 [Streptococcus himalayensis]|uniref:Uncharacterized protein n=3 Tax=Bacteria TaxID=2 RepID=A0A917EGZ5_9STRE|nr:hypothetical protein GCM10011502_30470 [Oceanisphaera marina]GGC73645.1 hypothetical protein GCM10011504_58710 [Siccirubricoccus deserti]GGE38325.1 hypothetical protein GCM10011510_19650 [Streptococcus himalayensis]GHF03117.1 hypothetical protein GCM10011501_35350 [Thalassotalea profundi]
MEEEQELHTRGCATSSKGNSKQQHKEQWWIKCEKAEILEMLK